MSDPVFEKYFTLDEAVSWLPWATAQLKEAAQELEALRDEAILSKRLLMTRRKSGRKTSDEEVAVLQKRFDAFELAVKRVVEKFAAQGIILRDMDRGLLDFPYLSESTGEVYFLCWRYNEDGIFYFHGLEEGYAGRHPITLLPE